MLYLYRKISLDIHTLRNYRFKKFACAMAKSALNLKAVFNKERTFRPKKHFEPGTSKFDLHKRAQASLRSGKAMAMLIFVNKHLILIYVADNLKHLNNKNY